MDIFLTRTEEIFLHPSGIVKCRVLKDVYMTVDDAKENIEVIRKLMSDRGKALLLVDIRDSKGASKECRDYYASEEVGEVQKACAMIVNSPFTVLVGSFFLGLNKTVFPTKLFRSEEAAVQWLETFL